MARFQGTIQEYHHMIGPRIRNLVQNSLRNPRKERNGICEHCGEKKELQSAHVHGKGRRDIIETVLQNYSEDGSIDCDLEQVEQEIAKHHHPIEETFKFLCKRMK